MMLKRYWSTGGALGAVLLLILCTVLALPVGQVWADVGEDVDELKDQISDLQNKVKDLERRLAEAPAAAVAIPAAEAPTGAGFLRSAGDISVSGFVQTAYNVVFGDQLGPAGNNLGAGALRVFDNDADTFALNAGEIVLERLAPETGGVGFRTDIFFGEDAEVVGAGTTGNDADEFDFQQAYVQWVVPWGNGLDIKAGKFVTLFGAEVIESHANWNASRSLLFGFAIPFTHTGVRASYQLNDQWKVVGGINNGIDDQIDVNDAKAIEGQVVWTPNEEWFASFTGIVSPEQAGFDSRRTWLFDWILGWNATDKLSVMYNVDFARDQRALGTSADLEEYHWHGHALYAKYAVNDKLTLAWRGEIFIDNTNLRVGATNPEEVYLESTWGIDYRLYKDLLTRWELRFDKARGESYKGGSEDHQLTGLVQAIYQF